MEKIKELEEIDYLEVDKPIPGQNYVCLSFVSPEKIIEDKNIFFCKKFLKSLNNDLKLTDQNIEDKFQDFIEMYHQKLQSDFDSKNDNKTSIRGLKIRGVYESRREAEIRAKVLQRMDKSFHVFVGQVGYWLPWDPNPNNIQNQQYAEKELNNLVKSYKENEEERDFYYQEQLRKRKKEIKEENAKIKRENEKINEDTSNEVEQDESKTIQDDIIDKLINNESHSNLKTEFNEYNQNKNVKTI